MLVREKGSCAEDSIVNDYFLFLDSIGLSGGRSLVYCTVNFGSYIKRYCRCDQCGATSKTIVGKIILTSKHFVGFPGADAIIEETVSPPTF